MIGNAYASGLDLCSDGAEPYLCHVTVAYHEGYKKQWPTTASDVRLILTARVMNLTARTMSYRPWISNGASRLIALYGAAQRLATHSIPAAQGENYP